MYGKRKTNPRKGKGKSKNSLDNRVAKVEAQLSHVELKHMAPIIVRGTRITNALTDNTLQVINLMPDLVQGSGQGERIGNEVTTQKALVYFSAHLYQITSTPAVDPPKWLDIYIYKYKKSNEQGGLILNNFLQYGNTSIAYDSGALPESGSLQINTDKYILKKHIRKELWNPRTDNEYAAATRNSSIACQMTLDITKYMKKSMLYDDSVSNQVSNDNLYLSCVYTNVDGQVYASNLVVGDFDTCFMYQYTDL